ncbi:MAG TPA: lysylphosphatidylglycerol synthase transmembrane domain-containing protein [Kofleriaceae bacterium]|nr:lysylphosphatidylglycerol synthase transmembrane domain-containing protein [Kofleriaceae bacterium]
MRRWIWIAIAVVIAVGAAVTLGDVRQLADRLGGFRWPAFAAALGLALANYAIRFVRWQIYLRRRGVRVPAASSALVFGAGLSLSITPGKVGELVKSYLLRELHGIPATLTAPIVVAERVTDLLALLVLSVAGVAAFGLGAGFVSAAAAAIAAGLVLLSWPRPARALIDFLTGPGEERQERQERQEPKERQEHQEHQEPKERQDRPQRPQRPRWLTRLRAPLHAMYDGLATLCRPRLLAAATLLAVPAWACECVGFALIVNAFPGAHVGLGLAMVIYASTTIAGALSFLPGGLGVTEAAMTMLLVSGAARLDRGAALDATLLTRLATLWFAVGIGVVCLAVARRRGNAARRGDLRP